MAIAAPVAEFVVSIGADGRITSQGSLSSALAKDKYLSAEVSKESEAIEKAEHDPLEAETAPDAEIKAAAQSGKLIVEEEVEVGHVGWDASAFNILDLSISSSDFPSSETFGHEHGRQRRRPSVLGSVLRTSWGYEDK